MIGGGGKKGKGKTVDKPEIKKTSLKKHVKLGNLRVGEDGRTAGGSHGDRKDNSRNRLPEKAQGWGQKNRKDRRNSRNYATQKKLTVIVRRRGKTAVQAGSGNTLNSFNYVGFLNPWGGRKKHLLVPKKMSCLQRGRGHDNPKE